MSQVGGVSFKVANFHKQMLEWCTSKPYSFCLSIKLKVLKEVNNEKANNENKLISKY